MKITNQKFLFQYKMFQLFLIILVLGILIWYFTASEIVQANNRETIIGVLAFYLVAEYILYLRKYYLLNYSDENGKIEIEYSGKKTKISFLHENLEKFEIRNTGLRKELILFEKIKDGIKEHAPISLSAFSKADIKNLLESLTSIINKNKKQ